MDIQARIVRHRCTGGRLSFEIERDGNTSWVFADDIPECADARRYWRSVIQSRSSGSPKHITTRCIIQTPSRILDVKQFNSESFVLCEFDGIDVPVLVPMTTAKNAFAQLVITFIEGKLERAPGTESHTE
jgi:hypothetical protein